MDLELLVVCVATVACGIALPISLYAVWDATARLAAAF